MSINFWTLIKSLRIIMIQYIILFVFCNTLFLLCYEPFMITQSLAYRLPQIYYHDVIDLKMSLRQDKMNNDTETSTVEMDLHGIQQLKSQIVTQISHEFRTPLTSIIGFAAMLEENKRIDDKQRAECAHFIRNEGLRLAKIVSDIIELDAIEQGRTHFLFEESEIQK